MGPPYLVVVGPPYLVVYRIEPSVVVILRVPHGAHRWPRDGAATNPPLLIEVAVSGRGLGFCHRRYVTAGAAEIIGFVRDAQAKGANRGRGAVGSVASPRQPRARRHGHQLGRCQGTDRMAAGVMSARIEAWDLWSLHARPQDRRDANNGLRQPAQAE